jgi:hypothetical protein
MRILRLSLGSALAFVTLLVGSAGPARAGEAVALLVVREHGVGSAAQAQGYLDRLVRAAAQQNGWAAAEGKYFTERGAAEGWITSRKPHFGILSLAAYLALRGKHGLAVIGKARIDGAGGGQYHLVSKTAKDLAGCRGQTVASDHTDDVRFVEKVVAGGAFRLGDFTLVPTKRPVQTLKAVVRGEAVCALVDDAQVAELARLEGGGDVKSVWKSAVLPPMVVVAFPSASAEVQRGFRAKLAQLCTGEGKSACADTGIRTLEPASDADYRKVVAAYGS